MQWAIGEFQSTLPVWGATRFQWCVRGRDIFQSTLPVWGATWNSVPVTVRQLRFQSTLPVWGATGDDCGYWLADWDFNPRSPYGERHVLDVVYTQDGMISIHAPRMGSDRGPRWQTAGASYFNPRSPYGERQQIYTIIYEKEDENEAQFQIISRRNLWYRIKRTPKSKKKSYILVRTFSV